MTVNERLFEAGLMEAFDAAALAKDRVEMVRLLTELDVKGAAQSVDSILRNAQRYGY